MIIGPNNSGKSIPFRAFRLLASLNTIPEGLQRKYSGTNNFVEFSPQHWYKEDSSQPIVIECAFRTQHINCDKRNFYCPVMQVVDDPVQHQSYFRITTCIFAGAPGSYTVTQNPWVHVETAPEEPFFESTEPIDITKWKALFNSFHKYKPIDRDPTSDDSLKVATSSLSSVMKRLRFFSSVRKLTTDRDDSSEEVMTGRDVTSRILSLQESDSHEGYKNLYELTSHLNKLIDPSNHFQFKNILVNKNGEIRFQDAKGVKFPLSRLGSGLEALIILLCEIFLNESPTVYFLEEPEHHLHPGLLARLLHFLKRHCDQHQFIISTHSPTLLDSIDEETRVYRTSLSEDGSCTSTSCKELSDFHQILDGMGIRASSLLLANTVIWVEGPSDVAYISAWFEMIAERDKDKELVKNSDYSLVHYGGSLISHLTASDESEQALKIFRICRRVAIIADNDRVEDKKLKPTLERMRKELQDRKHGRLILTRNKEIENDLEPEILIAALKLTFTELSDVLPNDFIPDNSTRIQSQLAKLLKLEDLQSTDFDRRYNGKKMTLAKHAINEMKKHKSAKVPDYISELVDFVIRGRDPEELASKE